MERSSVVTCFLRNGGEVLLFLRAADAGTYPGTWGTVTGYVEHEDPLETARMEIREETGMTDVSFVRRGESFEFRDGNREWAVTPFLFDVDVREVRLNEETERAEWAHPTAILRRETVPELWTSYDRVRPTPETIEADDEHGSAYLSIRALEILRDEAGLAAAGGTIEAVREVAGEILDARPSMAALRNRVNRAMAAAGTPEAIESAAIEGIERAREADAAAARAAAELIRDGRVCTLSRSGTVSRALLASEPEVVIGESRPAREGVDVAEGLAGEGIEVTLCTDAAIAHVLAECDVDAVLVGADTILPDGRVVNKTGTRGTAIAARREGVPVYVVAASDKISHRSEPHLESGPREAVYDGDTDLDVTNPRFDVTPADCVGEIVTERGRFDPGSLDEVVGELRDLARWRS